MVKVLLCGVLISSFVYNHELMGIRAKYPSNFQEIKRMAENEHKNKSSQQSQLQIKSKLPRLRNPRVPLPDVSRHSSTPPIIQQASIKLPKLKNQSNSCPISPQTTENQAEQQESSHLPRLNANNPTSKPSRTEESHASSHLPKLNANSPSFKSPKMEESHESSHLPPLNKDDYNFGPIRLAQSPIPQGSREEEYNFEYYPDADENFQSLPIEQCSFYCPSDEYDSKNTKSDDHNNNGYNNTEIDDSDDDYNDTEADNDDFF